MFWSIGDAGGTITLYGIPLTTTTHVTPGLKVVSPSEHFLGWWLRTQP